LTRRQNKENQLVEKIAELMKNVKNEFAKEKEKRYTINYLFKFNRLNFEENVFKLLEETCIKFKTTFLENSDA
jgi:hypothetical protein